MELTHYSQVFWNQVEKYGDRIAFYYNPKGSWEGTTWKNFGEQVRSAARGLIDFGVGELEMVGIFSQNRPEWTIADFASLTVRAVPVPIYATDTAKQAEYIINDAEIKIIFVGDQDQYDKIMEVYRTNDFLKKIIVFNENVRIDRSENIMYFKEFLDAGRKSESDGVISDRLSRAKKDDLLTLIYTSGTTGEPKGVMLTHSNVISQADSHDLRLLPSGEDDVSLCFLPLSHVFERVWTYYTYYKGMTVYYLDDPKKIIDVIQDVKPTVMCAVPRFYEKIHAAVFDKLETASPMKKKMFMWAVDVGRDRNNLKKDQKPVPGLLELKYKIADKLVLGKIRDLTGGRIRYFPCAGAPLSQKIEEFFYAVGIYVCYGYGLSESTATTTCHEPHNFKFGTVGKPIPGVEVKIDPANDEILIRGGNIMKGYYKKPQATADVFTEDGWFRTGDAGEFDENGELRITDRIKELMKTSGGKYIPPQLIETLVGADHYIEQSTIIGDNRKYVTALIVPNFPVLEEYARSNNIPFSSREDLVKHPEIYKFYEQRVTAASAELAGFQKIKYFTLLPNEFTVDSGEITPTMKIKRKVIAEKYKDVIEDMYEK